jgi:adenosylhomocysteinase
MSLVERQIIRALKFGKVPANGARRLATGRDAEIAEIGRILTDVAQGTSEVRLLRGDYGSGKTFMCSVVRDLAFERNFAVSIVNLNRDVPFGKRELVLDQVVGGLRTANVPTDPAFGSIVEAWFARFALDIPLEQNDELKAALSSISSLDANFASGLRAWLRAFMEGNSELMDSALAWIRGVAIAAEQRSQLKLVGKLTPEVAFRRLKAILRFIHEAGFPGVVILLDEAESIMRLQAQQRLAAYTSIRELVDTCDVDFPYSFFLFAGTQPLFEDPTRGIASYEALYQRIRNQSASSERDLRQPIIRLEELDSDSLVAVAKRVRDLHAIAYDWNAQAALSDTDIDRFVVDVATRFGEIRQKPRAFLKALVDILDAKQQGLGIPESHAAVESAMQLVEAADTQLDDDVVLAGS